MNERKIIGYDYFKLAVAIILILLMLALRTCSADDAVTANTNPPSIEVVASETEPTEDNSEVDVQPAGNAAALKIDLGFEDLFEGPNQIQGQADPNVDLGLIFNGEETTPFASDVAGNWQTEVDLVAGDNSLQLLELDADGTTVASSELYTFIVQPIQVEVEPLELTINPLAEGLIAGAHTLAGTATPDTQLEIFVDGQSVGITTSDHNGDWTFPFEILEGDHSVEVQVQALEGDTLTKSIEVSVVATQSDEGEDKQTDTGNEGSGGGAQEGADSGSSASGWVPDLSRCGLGEIKGDIYIVNYCENLPRIADRLGVAYADLVAANPQIEDPCLIYPYQGIHIPTNSED